MPKHTLQSLKACAVKLALLLFVASGLASFPIQCFATDPHALEALLQNLESSTAARDREFFQELIDQSFGPPNLLSENAQARAGSLGLLTEYGVLKTEVGRAILPLDNKSKVLRRMQQSNRKNLSRYVDDLRSVAANPNYFQTGDVAAGITAEMMFEYTADSRYFLEQMGFLDSEGKVLDTVKPIVDRAFLETVLPQKQRWSFRGMFSSVFGSKTCDALFKSR